MYFWCWQRSTTKGLWPLTIWKVRLSTVAAEEEGKEAKEEGKEAEEEGKEGEQEHKRSLIKVYLHKNGISDACHMLHRRYHMWYFNWSSELSWSQCRPYWFHVHHFLFSNRRHSTDDWTVRLSEPTRWILSVSVSSMINCAVRRCAACFQACCCCHTRVVQFERCSVWSWPPMQRL